MDLRALGLKQPRGCNSGRSLQLNEPIEKGCMAPRAIGALAMNQPRGVQQRTLASSQGTHGNRMHGPRDLGALALNQPRGYNSGRSLQLKESMEK